MFARPTKEYAIGSAPPNASYPLEGPASIPSVRHWLAALRDDGVFDADDDHLYDIQLACTELAANAIEHAGPPRSVRVVAVTDEALLVEVTDGSPLIDVTVGRSRVDGTRGRGLAMVSMLARRWGVTRRDDLKVLWAWLRTR